MGVVEVRAPDGRVWIIRREIVWPRWHLRGGSLPPLELDPTGLALLVLLPLVVAVVLVVLFSFVALVVEAVFVVLAAFLFRGRWLVEATTPGPPPARTERRVRGWRRSKQAAEKMARELQTDSA